MKICSLERVRLQMQLRLHVFHNVAIVWVIWLCNWIIFLLTSCMTETHECALLNRMGLLGCAAAVFILLMAALAASCQKLPSWCWIIWALRKKRRTPGVSSCVKLKSHTDHGVSWPWDVMMNTESGSPVDEISLLLAEWGVNSLWKFW